MTAYHGWISYWSDGTPLLTVKDNTGRTVFSDMGLPDDDHHGPYLEWAEWNDYEPTDAKDFLAQVEWIVERETGE